jgi:RNA recognition motif-containing protein
MSVYVGNLSYDVSQDDLRQVFEDYGTVSRVSLPMDRETNRPRGFAFVDMSSKAEEAAAIEALNEAEWMGRTLRVNEAKPKDNSRSDSFGRRQAVSMR